MKNSPYTNLLFVAALAACHRPAADPLLYQTLHLNYSIEDGLWSYDDTDYFFILSDVTTFDDSSGTLQLTTPYPLDSTYCEINGTNCPTPITQFTWSIGQLQPGQWQLTIQLSASTVACIQEQSLWDNDYWWFDFSIRVLP